MPRANPNNPAIAGLEWYPARRLPRPLAPGRGIGVQFVSTATETIDVVVANIVPAGTGGSAQVGLDIYDASSVGTTETITGGMAQAASDGAQTAGWEQSNDIEQTFSPIVAGNAWSFVNKIIPESYDSAAIAFIVAGIGRTLRFRPSGSQTEGHLLFQQDPSPAWKNASDGNSGSSPVGRRIAWVELSVAMYAQNGASPTVDGWIRLNGTNYGSEDGPRRISPQWQRYVWRFVWNPATGRQWYASDLAAFASGGAAQFGLSVAGAQAGVDFRLGAMNITYRTLLDHRVAVGYANAPATLDADRWTSFIMLNKSVPTNLTWPKQNAHEYLCVFYMTGTGGQAGLVGVDQASLAEDPNGSLQGWVGADQTMLQVANRATMIPSANATFSSWAPGMYMTTTAPAGGVDLQTYVQPGVLPIGVGDGVRGGVISTHATATYGETRIVVACMDVNGQVAVPNAPLVAQLKTVSGDTATGGTITINPSEVPADGRWHLLQRHFSSSASLLAGTAYYLSLTSVSTVPWGVLYASNQFAVPAPGWTIPGELILDGVHVVDADLVASVSTVPPAPTGFTGSVGTFHPTVDPVGGPGAGVKYAALDWTSSGLGADFSAYEVARADASTGPWNTIARITLESSSYLNDPELRRGVPQFYRLRVVRADSATSDWVS